ncbi:uncharacterized protein FIBRA_00499 [Fibroporia radiculosa]|uniref:lytic cellulose monooxygenase (C4-dehydrogenating) n=1 Tax=Fibroporia radiculosa TaxID=599839 RepID=J4I7Z1_9APHY|nr:uncharacterized protein FIBRA_00499 [Fibroporia radiculosa]CCL98501.1 predicted protein [Fibroporia radiculosa]
MSSFLLFVLLHIPLALAHGYVSRVTVDGTEYVGNPPGHNTSSSPIRMVSSNGPVQNLSSPFLACGPDAQPAQLEAIAAPGSVINITWVSGGGGNWPHEVGPVLTYMAECTNTTTCKDFDTTGARWFKIDEAGKQSDNVSWVQLYIEEGRNFNMTLPENLAPGPYLLRNEIIGLQNAMARGGAEPFPSCTQLIVTGNGTGVPAANETVSFPGAYNSTDPGIWFNAYDNTHTPYVFPGPPVAVLINATAAQTNDTETNNTTAPALDAPSPEKYKLPPSGTPELDAPSHDGCTEMDATPVLTVMAARGRIALVEL